MPVLAPPEGPAKRRPHAEQVEEGRRNDSRAHPDRIAVSEERELHVVVLRHSVERPALRLEIAHLGRRELRVLDARSGSRLAEQEEPVLPGEGERTQKDRVDGGEERGVDPDAEAKGDDGDEGRSGRAGDHAPPVAHVLGERLERRQAARVAALFPDLGDAAEFGGGDPAGLLGRRSGLDELGGPHLEMEGDLPGHFAIDLLRRDGTGNFHAQRSKESHDPPSCPATRSTRLTAAESRLPVLGLLLESLPSGLRQ